MGKGDVVMNRWLSDKRRLASLVNSVLFDGTKVFSKEHLKDYRNQSLMVRTSDGKEVAVEKYRDICMQSDDGTTLIMLSCENQGEIHYAMPVRGMLYDALSYTDQVNKLKKIHRTEKRLKESAEFLSGLPKEEILCPVITVVFYYGEEPWDGHQDLHGLLGLDRTEYQKYKKYIPNYQINLIQAAVLDNLESMEKDLQMVIGMLKYRKNKNGLKNYIDEHRDYFSDIDEESYQAARVMMGNIRAFEKELSRTENGGINMCQALEEWYQDGVNEGIEKGIEKGITVLIKTCQDFKITYEDVFCKVKDEYRLTDEQTRAVMEKNWR